MDIQQQGAWVHLPQDAPKFATVTHFFDLEDPTLLFTHLTQKFHTNRVLIIIIFVLLFLVFA